VLQRKLFRCVTSPYILLRRAAARASFFLKNPKRLKPQTFYGRYKTVVFIIRDIKSGRAMNDKTTPSKRYKLRSKSSPAGSSPSNLKDEVKRGVKRAIVPITKESDEETITSSKKRKLQIKDVDNEWRVEPDEGNNENTSRRQQRPQRQRQSRKVVNGKLLKQQLQESEQRNTQQSEQPPLQQSEQPQMQQSKKQQHAERLQVLLTSKL
jgi:hypothetical protein